jgi:hypothetical protein
MSHKCDYNTPNIFLPERWTKCRKDAKSFFITPARTAFISTVPVTSFPTNTQFIARCHKHPVSESPDGHIISEFEVSEAEFEVALVMLS